MEKKFDQQIFLATGNSPLRKDAIERILKLENGIEISSLNSTWPEKLIIIIGRNNFSEFDLKRSLYAKNVLPQSEYQFFLRKIFKLFKFYRLQMTNFWGGLRNRNLDGQIKP